MAVQSAQSDVLRQDFMTLLVTQLKNQDPLEPVSQTEFLGQLAQFSTLESMEGMNANFADFLKLQELSQGTNLIGRTIEFGTTLDGNQSGVVSAVHLNEGAVVAEVGDRLVPMNSIIRVQ
ncbi:MAG: flagellar hook capping FlgD N-terminal domain-containing protein [Pirellulaceae bacterium]